jgi:hypothetical protein
MFSSLIESAKVMLFHYFIVIYNDTHSSIDNIAWKGEVICD